MSVYINISLLCLCVGVYMYADLSACRYFHYVDIGYAYACIRRGRVYINVCVCRCMLIDCVCIDGTLTYRLAVCYIF